MNRSFISECYSHIKEKLKLQEYNALEPLFMQSMSNVFDELDKIKKERDYWKKSFFKQVEASRR